MKRSIVSQVVGAAIAASSFTAIASDEIPQNYNAIHKVNQASSSLTVNTTVSGMKSQYDNKLKRTTFAWAKSNQTVPNLSNVPAPQKNAYAADFYVNQLTGYSPSKTNAIRAVLTSMHDQGHGAKIAKYKQEVVGIEVFNREYNVMMDANHKLVAASGYFAEQGTITKFSNKNLIGESFGQPKTAIETAFKDLGGDTSQLKLQNQIVDGKYTKFNFTPADGYQLLNQPRAKKVYFEHKGDLIAAYYVEVEAGKSGSVDSDFYSYVISSKTGKVLFKHNLTVSDFSYRVYADESGTNKPSNSPHGKVVPAVSKDQEDKTTYDDAPLITLSAGPISTNDAWLAEDATTTNGNNVFAYVDAIAPDGFTSGDFTAELTGPKTFDYKYDTDQRENSVHNRKAATVNLFYLNNYLHNEFYDHGFDEVAGNAQVDNYGRGGAEDDVLRAEVQDHSGFNNANMSTPSDGASPRMQMFLFDSKDAVRGTDHDIKVTIDSTLTDDFERLTLAGFGPEQYRVSGDIARIIDGTAPANDGCEAATNAADLVNKIVLIDRGACSFVQKVTNAQNAGAKGVIIANNQEGDVPALGGGDGDEDITIPSVGINQADGQIIHTALDANTSASAEFFNNKPFKGSSWDNGIVAHEWGHYISNRLVGNSSGLINQQGRSMGEGWGDFHALLLLSDEADLTISGNDKLQKAYAASSYVSSFYRGIRKFPYTTDMEVNPLTFASVTLGDGSDPLFAAPDRRGNAEVHDAGEPWAVMLWDSFVALVNDERHTYSEAKSRMMDYLVAGYKMTPVAPTYTEARDAILAAAFANDEQDYKLILAAFARRGMGLGAVSPDRNDPDHTGVVESTKTELAAFVNHSAAIDANYEGLMVGYCSNDNVLDTGETGTVSFTVANRGSETLTGLVGKVEVLSDHTVTFANEGAISFDDLAPFASVTNIPLEFSLDESGVEEELVLRLTFPDLAEETQGPDSFDVTTLVNYDFETKPLVDNSAIDDMEDVSSVNDWTEVVMVGGKQAIGTRGFDNGGNIGFFESFGFDLGDRALTLENNGFLSDVAIETKPFQVGYGDGLVIDFFHFYAIEENYDAGVIEISINGADWVDVTAAGGKFKVGYDGPVNTSPVQPLSERPVFHGRSISDTGVFGNNETITFDSSLNGNEVRLRFRIASDTNANDLGWWIDNVKFSNVTTPILTNVIAGSGEDFVCDNRLPTVTSISENITVAEGADVTLSIEATDSNQDSLTYSWVQTSGESAKLSAADTSKVTVTAPAVGSDQVLMFEATINDGTATVKRAVSVKVNNVPTSPTPVTSSSSSGGSSGLLGLLLLPLMMLRRRMK